MLNSKQRAYLRSQSQNLDTIFQIGKGGITEEICNQIYKNKMIQKDFSQQITDPEIDFSLKKIVFRK